MQQNSSLIFWLLFTLLALPSQAVTVLDNTTQYSSEANLSNASEYPVSTFADLAGSGSFAALASSFKTGTSNLSLNTITLLMDPGDNITGSSQPLTVSIYSDSTSQAYFQDNNGIINSVATSHPGSLVGSIALTAVTSPRPNPSSFGTPYTWSYVGGLALNPTTTYWIVVGSTDTSGDYRVVADYNGGLATAPFTNSSGWSVTSSTTVGNFATYSTLGTSFTGEPVNAWLTYPNDPFFFKIDASTAGVPEPSKPLLMMLGCAGMLYRRRRNAAKPGVATSPSSH